MYASWLSRSVVWERAVRARMQMYALWVLRGFAKMIVVSAVYGLCAWIPPHIASRETDEYSD